MRFLVTGGAGFIGSAVIRYLIKDSDHDVLNVDKLTYAGNLSSLDCIAQSPRYEFSQVDICDTEAMRQLFFSFRPDVVMHLAAESHVDRSIDGPAEFIQTNIVGTYTLLEVARKYWSALDENSRQNFRFHHVSTDEVYGDLEVKEDGFFTEETGYDPSSPYAASKAASDHLVRAWQRTYGLPTLITCCSNNYGPFHFPEKLIPLTILNALSGRPIPVYGDGSQVRDWLYVEDHARALVAVALRGKVGETYNIGARSEKKNIEVVKTICSILDELAPGKPNGIKNYSELIRFVADRPGHDLRYAIDARKIQSQLGWEPLEAFETGVRKTVEWYLNNKEWWMSILEDK